MNRARAVLDVVAMLPAVRRAFGFGETEETVQYKVGTANIDVVDARKKMLIWVGIAEGRLTDAMMNNPDNSIARIVSDIFAKFPGKAAGQ